MKTLEIFEGDRAKAYDTKIKLWVPRYDVFHSKIRKIIHNTFHQKKIDLLIIGCGTGKEIQDLNLSPFWQITAFDPSPEMLIQAEINVRNTAAKNVMLIQGDIHAVEQSDFQAATMVFVLQFLSDDGAKLELLKQIYNRLSINGILFLLDIYSATNFRQKLNGLKRIIKDKNKVGLPELDKWTKHVNKDLYCITENRLHDLVYESGFSKIEKIISSYIFGGWVIKK